MVCGRDVNRPLFWDDEVGPLSNKGSHNVTRRRCLDRTHNLALCCMITSLYGLDLGFPPPQTGPRIHISWKRGFRGPKTPISPRPHKGRKREFLVQKSPFSMCSPCRKKGIFWTENSLFQNEGEMGVFGPRNPLFQEMGIRGPVWGRGNPKARCDIRMMRVLWLKCSMILSRHSIPGQKVVASDVPTAICCIRTLKYQSETGGILFREYCFGEEDSLSLNGFYGKLGEFCEKLGELALAHK